MFKHFSVLFASACALVSGLQLRRVGLMPWGPGSFAPCVADCDHDGLPEAIFQSHTRYPTPAYYWSIAEYVPVNRYRVVKSDTGTGWPFPPGFVTGNFWPRDAGDIDGDGLVDLTGIAPYVEPESLLHFPVLCNFECPDSFSYPETTNWHHVFYHDLLPSLPSQYFDLDNDGRFEIVTAQGGRTHVFENVANNRESLVSATGRGTSGRYCVADYDVNGRLDFPESNGQVVNIYECAGDNQFVQTCSLNPRMSNGNDVFLGRDADRNGRPEFFISDGWYQGLSWKLYLRQFEALEEHDYTWWMLDSENIGSAYPVDAASVCADLDSDGADEVVWSCASRIVVLKATAPHQYQRVAYWWNPAGPACLCTAHDMNGNGYPEVLVGGCDRISFLEVEAVRVLYPDRVRELEAGDTCEVRWRIITPPRCDSVSLFLKTDTVVPEGERFWRLDTIVTGLAPSESSYLWFVPDTVLNWAKVLAIAYGPGWQFDESDTFFSIRRTGLAEERPAPSLSWALSVRPNPASRNAVVSYVVPCPADIRLGLYNAGGRLVRELVSGERAPGRYEVNVSLPAGIYFCRLESPDQAQSRKVVLGK